MAILKFHNAQAVQEIRIGVHELNCIGTLPPHDHPHIYMNMQESVICPYCGTRFRFDDGLQPTETNPPGCHFEDTDPDQR